MFFGLAWIKSVKILLSRGLDGFVRGKVDEFMGREVYGLDAIATCSWVGKCRGWVLKVLPSGVEHCALRLSFYTFIPSFF